MRSPVETDGDGRTIWVEVHLVMIRDETVDRDRGSERRHDRDDREQGSAGGEHWHLA